MSEIELFDYFRSSASYRVRIALNLKQVAYTAIPTSLLAGEQRSDAYLGMNPQGFVPALAVGEYVLTQSLAIIDWLDRAYPDQGVKLIPEEPLPRARALALALTIACDIHPLNNLRVLKYLQTTLGLREDIRNNWYRHWVQEGLLALEAATVDTPGPFLGGEAPNIADVCLVPQMYNARRFEVELADFPRLLAADAAASALDAFAAATPERVKPAD